MRNDDTSPAGDHVATVDTWAYANLTYVRKTSSASGWAFVISSFSNPDWGPTCTVPEGNLYPFIHWGPWQANTDVVQPPPLLTLGSWYRLEYYVHFTSDTSIQVHPRVYDASGQLLFDDNTFRQQDWTGMGADTATLASYYAAGRDFCVNPGPNPNHPDNPVPLRSFGLGNNGQNGALDTGLAWYFADVQIRTDTWPGPYR